MISEGGKVLPQSLCWNDIIEHISIILWNLGKNVVFLTCDNLKEAI